MSEKRFELTEINPSVNPLDTVYFIIDYENPSKNIRNLKDCVDLLNEQQATIEQLQEENKELVKNFDDLVNWASEIAKRNVVLDEQIGKLQQEEKLYAQEILRLNELLKQYQSFKDLGGDY